MFAVIVLAVADLDRSAAVDPLAPYVLYARLGQSAAHPWGVEAPQVLVRARLRGVQLVPFVWMLLSLAG